ncbi:UNVERIFIED_CONTAM: hypothetical protein Sindi_1668400 [Sesamum indicum]
MSVWPDLKEVTSTNNGFFFLQFKSGAAMEDVIEGGLWLFQGQPIVLKKWESGMVLRKLQHTQVPVRIKLRHLPVDGLGKPLYPDAITRACTRLDFARVCVMLDVTSNLPKHIIIMTPDEDGGESPCKVDVQYEWLPQKCQRCMTMGHSDKECILNKPKPAKPPIAVYVPKVGTPDAAGPSRDKRGKALVIYNTFDALHLLDDTDESSRAIWNVRGLNKRDHQLAVKDIVAEFRLQFLGLLETRVRINNVSHIQALLLPQWKWFVDYGSSGNRIWIVWDENFIDVDVVECGTQFIHCHVNIRALHESIAITVIYGANELVERRALWGSMETIAMQSTDTPWLVGGDFNTVRDLSEICGVSGDIRMAMEDFNTCIQNTGLLPLPMQGEWYTWHNCSAGPRKLWKRLDRMLINDRWMAQFPTSYYYSLIARTSDHSPMVLCGDIQQQLGGMFRFDNYLALSPEFIPSVQQWMKGGDQCSRVFFRKITQRRSARRILQINDEHGATHTDPGAVINEFVMYYQNLPGGERRRDMIDLRFLRPWAIHILSEDDVNSLVLPFTPTDVKQAIFDIAEDKAPGPDGYSSGFFKAAWPIIGQEVSSAVLDFFHTGRILK